MERTGMKGRPSRCGHLLDAAMFFRSHGRLVAFSSLSLGWVMAVFADDGIWRILAGEANSAVRWAYVVSVCAFLVLVFAFAKPEKARSLLLAANAVAAAGTAAYLVLPGAAGAAVWAIVAGGASGAIIALIVLYFVYGLRAPSRFLPLSATVMGFYAVSAMIAFFVPLVGKIAFASLLFAFYSGSAVMALGLDPPSAREDFERKPFPAPLIGVFSALVFFFYFAFYAFETVRIAFVGESLPPATPSGTVWLPRIAGVAVFLAAGRRLPVVWAFYASIAFMLLSFALRLLGPGWSIPAEICMGLCYSLSDVSIGTISLDIAYQHGRGRSVMLLIGGLVGAAIVGAGALQAPLAGLDPIALSGGLIAFLCLTFLPLPGIMSFFERELAAVSALPGGGEEEVVRNLSYARVSPERAIAILRGHFDGEYRLSDREEEVARLLLDRYDYGTIASRLGISVNTTKVHAKSVYRKCDVSGRKALIALAAGLGEGRGLA